MRLNEWGCKLDNSTLMGDLVTQSLLKIGGIYKFHPEGRKSAKLDENARAYEAMVVEESKNGRYYIVGHSKGYKTCILKQSLHCGDVIAERVK